MYDFIKNPALRDMLACPEWAAKAAADDGRSIIYNLPDVMYHGTPALISKGGLDKVARTPLHWRYNAAPQDEDAPDSDAFLIGKAFHALGLEEHTFRQRYVKLPDFGTMQSSRNRALRDDWIRDEGQDRIPLKESQWDRVHAMRDALHRHPAARKLMARGTPEVTATWRDPHTELMCKSRADWLYAEGEIFVDLKSARDASPELWRREAALRRYHVQDTFYSRAFEENGLHISNFVFIVVEKEPPYATGVYQLDDTARLKGEQLYMRELELLRKCMETDNWPAYSDKVVDMRLPAYATADDVAPHQN